MKFKHIASVFGILLILYVISMVMRQGYLARNASLKPVGWRKNFWSIIDSSIIIFFEAKNSTDIDITLKNIKIDVFINEKKATEIQRKVIHVPGGETIITEAIVRFNPTDVLLNAADAILRGMGDVPIRFKGHFDIITNYFFWNRMRVDESVKLSELIKK